MEKVIDKVRSIKYCILTGAYELAYEKIQDLEDALTTMAIKNANLKPPRQD